MLLPTSTSDPPSFFEAAKLKIMFVEEKHLAAHLKTINMTKWQLLFDLIPIIKSQSTFGTWKNNAGTFPYLVEAPVVKDFFRLVHEMPIMVRFNWVNWEMGKDVAKKVETFDFSTMNLSDLCKFVTMVIRSNRFKGV